MAICITAQWLVAGGQQLEVTRQTPMILTPRLIMSIHEIAMVVVTLLPCAVSLSLPTTNEQNVATKANQLANFPLNFLRTGHYNASDGKMYYRTTGGRWWSSNQSDEINAEYLLINTGFVSPQNSSRRGDGFALRCVP